MKLQGRRALITGASQGLGLAIARAFMAEGADVMLCARDEKALLAARDGLAASTAGRSRLCVQRADVSCMADVEALVRQTLADLGGLEVLICNAGIYGPKGPSDEVDWQEWERAISINLMGTVLPCRVITPHFKQHMYGKIVLISGGGATKPLPFLSAYAASKAAVVRYGETLAEELRKFRVDVNSVAPGALNTRLVDEVLEAGPDKVGQVFYEQNKKVKEGGGTPLERGAALCVYLASSASDGLTGKLISAAWDPWETLHERLRDLRDNDIYTLRRIVPKDRGQAWG